jgi:acyl carrier protein
MVVIEEEFGIKLSFDQLWELGTFQAIEKHLLERCQLSSERSEPLTD